MSKTAAITLLALAATIALIVLPPDLADAGAAAVRFAVIAILTRGHEH